MMDWKLSYYILEELEWADHNHPPVVYLNKYTGKYEVERYYISTTIYTLFEYYFPEVSEAVSFFPYTAHAKLRITADNTNYTSTLLRIHTANSAKAKLRIKTDSRIQAKLKIETRGPARAPLYIITLRASPRPQAKLRIVTNNSNYASALLRIETKVLKPAQAKLSIRTRTYNRRISMSEYYTFYNIATHGFLP